MARFGLISLNLIRSEGALSDCRNCIGKLVGGPSHTMVAFANFGVSPFGKDKVMTARKGWRGHGQPTSQWAGWCQGRERGGWPAWAFGKRVAGQMADPDLSIYHWDCEVLIFLLGKNLENLNRGCSRLEGRAQNQPGSDFQVEHWGNFFGPFPVTLYFWAFTSHLYFWAFSSHPLFLGLL